MLNPRVRTCQICGNADPKKITLIEIMSEACRIQCQGCHLIYFDRVDYPKPSYNHNYNKEFYRPTDIKKAGIMACRIAEIAAHRLTTKKILEIGPGNELTALLLKYLNFDVHVNTEDKQLTTKLAMIYNIPSYPGKLEEANIKTKFEYIYAGHVVEHADDTLMFFMKVRNLLLPEGLFIFDTPDAKYWTPHGSSWKHFRTRQLYEHSNLVSEKTIQLIASGLNFEIVTLELLDTYQSIFAILRKP